MRSVVDTFMDLYDLCLMVPMPVLEYKWYCLDCFWPVENVKGVLLPQLGYLSLAGIFVLSLLLTLKNHVARL